MQQRKMFEDRNGSDVPKVLFLVSYRTLYLHLLDQEDKLFCGISYVFGNNYTSDILGGGVK